MADFFFVGKEVQIVKIDTGTKWDFKVLSKDFVSLIRTIDVGNELPVADAFGPFWLVGVIELSAGKMEYRIGKSQIVLSPGKYGVVFPPYSLIRGTCYNTKQTISSIISDVKLPSFSSEYPCFFKFECEAIPGSKKELDQIVKYAYANATHVFKPEFDVIAEKSKRAIDGSFKTSKKLYELAQAIRTSPAQMTRAFKKAYGFTPLEYRNQMRVTSSVFELLQDHPIVDVYQSVGFEDLSRFYKQFKEITTTTPAKYKKSKNTKK